MESEIPAGFFLFIKVYDLSIMANQFIIYPDRAFEKTGFNQIRDTAAREAYTPYGFERVKQSRPSSDRKGLERKLSLTSEWIRLTEKGLHPPLTRLEDTREVIRLCRPQGSMIQLSDFLLLLEHAETARKLKDFFSVLDDEYPCLTALSSSLIPLKELEKRISRTINESAELRDDASSELRKIRSSLNRTRNNLRTTVQRILRKLNSEGMTSDEGATIRNGRMVIPVLAEFKRKVDGFIHDVSSTGQTIYLEPVEALQINNELRQLESDEKRETERIIRELSSFVRTFADELDFNIENIAELDEIYAKTTFGLKLNGTVPEIADGLHLKLIRASNPNLLLKNRVAKKKEPVIPLDLELSDHERALVITGPNAGGKSVAMKSVGILSLMFQCGFPLPLHPDSRLPLIGGLFVDMGDDQSIDDDLSTFSSRLNWIKGTLAAMVPGSLILVDEAGSGTDPEEGGALFQAFTEAIVAQGSRAIITTHHGSLKVFAHQRGEVVNGAMEFNQEHLSPTYRFRKGIPGSSYAFEIADRMDLPGSLMERARALLGENRDKLGALLISLERNIQQTEELKASYQQSLSSLQRREKNLSEEQTAQRNKKNQILQKAYKDAEQILLGANQRIERAVEKIVAEGVADKEAIRSARNEVEQAKQTLQQEKEKLEEHTEKLKRYREAPSPGDYVLIGESQSSGELIELNGKKATVLVNGLRVKASLRSLVKTDPPKKKSSPKFTYTGETITPDLSVKTTLDLRGFRGEEAVKECTLYIDKALTRGLRQVEIIHGKGEGILQKLIHETLQKRDEVDSFSIAPWESGGSGCTVVIFK